MSLRAKIIRLASTFPAASEERKVLLSALQVAREVPGAGGKLIFRTDGNAFSMRTKPIDPPYNQTYDASILVNKGSVKVCRAALAVIQEFWDDIAKKDDLYAVQKLVNEQVLKRTGKYPTWHDYSMPD